MKQTTLNILRVAAAIAAAAGLTACGFTSKAETTTAQPGYSAVFLDSGAVFFGQLENAGQPYPVLTHTFYVQSAVNPETKQSTSVLIRRGKEWHGPDRMTLNARHILFVEPVTAGSKVAQLIAEAK